LDILSLLALVVNLNQKYILKNYVLIFEIMVKYLYKKEVFL